MRHNCRNIEISTIKNCRRKEGKATQKLTLSNEQAAEKIFTRYTHKCGHQKYQTGVIDDRLSDRMRKLVTDEVRNWETD